MEYCSCNNPWLTDDPYFDALQPENLLLAEDWTLRLADFGAAINLTEERAVTRTGTREWGGDGHHAVWDN